MSTSMCSLIVRTVRGFAQILITGRIGLPMTLPCPVGKKWTTKPDAAHSVTISAAADELSMNHRPGVRRHLGLVEHAVDDAFAADLLDVAERLFLDRRQAAGDVALRRLRIGQIARLVALDDVLVAIEHRA